MKYRPEIDGLRALAVVPVIFFHAGLDWVPGGFVGVDVFFVISGYLITSIILSEIRNGTFSLSGFYERRARRILPALYFVMVLCIPFAWFLFTPSELKQFSASFVSTLLFISNFFFRKEAGYFDAGAENQPLLHTWSLAVEEQYYILFPLLMLWLLRKHRKWLVSSMLFLAVAGLVYAEMKAGAGSSKDFFDTRSRGWALLAGSLLPILAVEQKLHAINQRVRELLAIAGVVLIVWSVVAFNSATHYPGLYTLAPVLGTVLVIVNATSSTITGRIVGMKPFVGVGLISYSAYLIHQPLFAFFRLHTVDEPEPLQMYLLSACTLILAFFSWKYIEAPFRKKSHFSKTQILYASASVGVVLLALGVVTHANDGFFGLPGRDQDVMVYAKYDKRPLYRERICFLEIEQDQRAFTDTCQAGEDGGLFVWGDSHAAAASVGIRAQFANRTAQYTAAGCPPLLGTDVAGTPHCRKINDFALEQVSRLKPAVVVLHADWLASERKASLGRLRDTILGIKNISATIRVVVIGGVPVWKPNLPAQINKLGSGLQSEYYLENPDVLVVRDADARLRQIVANAGGEFVSALDVYCKNSECMAVGMGPDRYEPIVWDGTHLTQAGSMILTRRLSDILSTQ